MGAVFVSVVAGAFAAALFFALLRPRSAARRAAEIERLVELQKAADDEKMAVAERQFASRMEEKDLRIGELSAALAAVQSENMALKMAAEKASVELEGERRQIESERRNFQKLQAENEARFRDIAQKVLDASEEKFRRGGEATIGNIVSPLAKDIADFRRRLEAVNVSEAERAAKLSEKIEGLVAQTNAVSLRANELAEAIRGQAQVTGQWAEVQLRRILELSGLKETIDYSYQETFAGEGSGRKNLRTDVIVKISEQEWIVIDSKGTVDSYVAYVQSAGGERDELAAKIVQSVKNHVDELKSVQYQRHIGKAFKYVLMYIPFEEVYLIAMKAQVKINGERMALREYARANGIVMVNSTSLLPTLQLVAATWQNLRSDRQAARIKTECEGLCRKVEAFLQNYLEIGKSVAKTASLYGAALGQLSAGRGNLIGRFRKLAELDVPAAAEIPDGDDYARQGADAVETARRILGEGMELTA